MSNTLKHLYQSTDPIFDKFEIREVRVPGAATEPSCIERDALAWLEHGDRHAYDYDPHAYAAAGVEQQGDTRMEYVFDLAFVTAVLIAVVGTIYTVADWWGSR
jgi:hypothetical protein